MWLKYVHFVMKTLKRENMVICALQTRLVHPKFYGSNLVLGHYDMSPLCIDMASH